jgi:hypothetical protein
MRVASVGTLGLLLLSCSSPEEQAHQVLMDQIESQIRLPAEARSLAEYSRNYAAGPKNEVVATYLIVPKGVPLPEGSALPGKRRWFNDMRQLPGISGGGCGEVNVVYDTAKSTVREVACNGDY